MKKYLMSLMALVLGLGIATANPVDVNRAKMVGEKFAQATLETKAAGIDLVYTAYTEEGTPCFYVFDIGKEGFVIISADDFYRPIVGYSDEGPYDPTNPGLNYLLGNIQNARSHRNLGKATPKVSVEWNRVSEYGLLFKGNDRGVRPLVETKWDQNYPYNYYCPANSSGPGGHVYAGCVATAMSQVMKYWDHPLQGTGSHNGLYGGSANFGATTYDWENMPISINANSPQVQIDAIATLMYHCGVAVNMNWAPDGSGAYSPEVPAAIQAYFGYASQAVFQYRSTYGLAVWEQKAKESLDMGWPLYYSGHSSDAGHAYVVDGYKENGYFHFNYGWSGSGNNWFTFETNEYNNSDGAIFNFVPQAVYNNAPQAPTNFTVTPGENVLNANITWTNPAKTLNNTNLTSIESVVVMRNEDVIAVIENPTPGATENIVDNDVPRFDTYDYQVFAVSNGSHGKVAYAEDITFGPTCNWSVMMTSDNFLGWKGGYISVFNAAGTQIGTCTTSTSSPTSVAVNVPVGHLSFSWTPGSANFNMTVIIKDSNNNTVFNYNGSSEDFAEGIFFTANNGCGNPVGTGTPSNLFAVRDQDDPYDILVTWDGVSDQGYGYNLYRDELLYRTILEGTSFTDNDVAMGGHCYYVSFLSYGGENENTSNESCTNAGEGCEPAKDFDYETTGAMLKIKLKWEKPENSEGLSGYYIFRRQENTDWKRIKAVGNPNTLSYTDNSLTEEGDYYYRIFCYYEETDCTSAPAAWIYDDNQYFLHVYWSPTAVGDVVDGKVMVYPNPTKANVIIEGENLQSVMVFNTVGQLVYSAQCEGNNAEINLGHLDAGLYMVKVFSEEGETIRKISVVK